MNNGHISDRFRDQVSLVVGGAQGIGKTISVRLAREGARVVIGDLDQVAMMHTSEELANEGWQVRSVLCDVANPRQVQRMVERTIGWYKQTS